MWLLIGSQRSWKLKIDESIVVGRRDCIVSTRKHISRCHVRLDVSPDSSVLRIECFGKQAYVFGVERRVTSYLGKGGVDFLRHADGFFFGINDDNVFRVVWHHGPSRAGTCPIESPVRLCGPRLHAPGPGSHVFVRDPLL